MFHSNVSTAIAKNVILSIPLPSSVDIQRSDVDVAVTPGGLANPTANVIVAGNATTLILDIGDLPRMSISKFCLYSLTSDPTVCTSHCNCDNEIWHLNHCGERSGK